MHLPPSHQEVLIIISMQHNMLSIYSLRLRKLTDHYHTYFPHYNTAPLDNHLYSFLCWALCRSSVLLQESPSTLSWVPYPHSQQSRCTALKIVDSCTACCSVMLPPALTVLFWHSFPAELYSDGLHFLAPVSGFWQTLDPPGKISLQTGTEYMQSEFLEQIAVIQYNGI